MTVYRLIAAEPATDPVSLLWRVLEVARSGFYARRSRRPSGRSVTDAALTGTIRAIQAIRCGRKRVARLMRTAGLVTVTTIVPFLLKLIQGASPGQFTAAISRFVERFQSRTKPRVQQ